MKFLIVVMSGFVGGCWVMLSGLCLVVSGNFLCVVVLRFMFE